jgi:two-component system, LytTR family, sensor kinase
VQFCYLLFIAANYYLHRLVSIPTLLYRKRYVLFAATVLGGIVVSGALRSLLAMYMGRHIFTPRSSPAFPPAFADSVLNITVWVGGLIAVHLLAEKIRFQRYIDAVEKEKTRNELDFLKAQFNPHFLFNSINSIYGHIDKGNRTARNMLLSFSDMLRYQLYECNVDAIPIDREINYIRNYIAIQQSRQEEDLVVRMHVGEGVEGFRIAPLLFIAFIENAFKYVGNSGCASGDKCATTDGCATSIVQIDLERNGDWLQFRVFNSREASESGERGESRECKDSADCSEQQEAPSTSRRGIGIANVRRRLELLYPGSHELQAGNLEGGFEVMLSLRISN